MTYQKNLKFTTKGRSITEITDQIAQVVVQAEISTGLCHLFLQHTSASLILCENADPDVRHDLEAFMEKLIPDGEVVFLHTAEGPDDMPAHIRSVFTHSDLTIPITAGQLALGTWQGIYLWEHRFSGHARHLVITIVS